MNFFFLLIFSKPKEAAPFPKVFAFLFWAWPFCFFSLPRARSVPWDFLDPLYPALPLNTAVWISLINAIPTYRRALYGSTLPRRYSRFPGLGVSPGCTLTLHHVSLHTDQYPPTTIPLVSTPRTELSWLEPLYGPEYTYAESVRDHDPKEPTGHIRRQG